MSDLPAPINSKLNKRRVLILTGLPFRKHGNQSMFRFVKKFLDEGIYIIMFSAGFDLNGERTLKHELFKMRKIPSLANLVTIFSNKLYSSIKKQPKANTFKEINSEDIIAAYGKKNFLTMVNKWFKFVLYIIDNLFITLYLIIFHFRLLKSSDILIAYEHSYTLASKILSSIFHKKYINKFQGVVALESTNKNKTEIIKYYPHIYLTINNSDLCIMVNDGSDGKYYAKLRGCENVLFISHGVKKYNHSKDPSHFVHELKKEGKFILFNNATNSIIERVDRIIRGMSKIRPEILKNIVLITTYHGSDRRELEEFAESLGIKDNILFIGRIDANESNYILQHSDVSIMVNDYSNLGNPILESIYYKVPVISIKHPSLEGFLEDGEDSFLIELDKEFDRNVASSIGKLYKDRGLLDLFKENLNKEFQVKELDLQQEVEFREIEKLF